jgi:hypothetical protein
MTDFEKAKAEQLAAREAAENGEVQPSGREIVSLATTLGNGATGPGWVKIAGQDIQVGPYTLRNLPLANLAISAMDINSVTLALAWSMRNGDGEMTTEDAVEVYENLVPEDKKGIITPEGLIATLAGGIADLGDEEMDALAEAIFLSVGRYNVLLTRDFVLDNLDYPGALKVLGKILSLNTGLCKRLFKPSGDQESQ